MCINITGAIGELLAMDFSNLRVSEITNVLRHTPSVRQWHSQKRETHIIGIQLFGVMHHEIGGKKLTLGENSLFFFNRDEDFSASVGELGESFTVHFKTDEPIQTESFAKRAQSSADAVSILTKLERLYSLHRANGHQAMSCFHRFCGIIEDLCEREYHKSDVRIERAREYMDLNYGDSEALCAAALVTGLSRRRFNTLFRAHLGVTPNEYLTSVRIANAKRLLTTGSISVSRVAQMCGFRDIYYFSKLFRAKSGSSPTEYVKSGGGV